MRSRSAASRSRVLEARGSVLTALSSSRARAESAWRSRPRPSAPSRAPLADGDHQQPHGSGRGLGGGFASWREPWRQRFRRRPSWPRGLDAGRLAAAPICRSRAGLAAAGRRLGRRWSCRPAFFAGQAPSSAALAAAAFSARSHGLLGGAAAAQARPGRRRLLGRGLPVRPSRANAGLGAPSFSGWACRPRSLRGGSTGGWPAA
jgi:hypothetical protein